MVKDNAASRLERNQSASAESSHLTPKQVARAIGVSESSVKRWCDAGLIEGTVTPGGHRRLSLESVQQFLKENNHLDVDPEIFSLNFSFGKSERALERGRDDFLEALLHGSESQLRQIINDYLDAGRAPAVVFDHILFDARAGLRQLIRECGADPYLDRLGTEICLRLMFELRSGFTPPRTTAPVALTAGLDGSPDALRVEAAEVLLYQQGWNARTIGSLIPFDQLDILLREEQPQLLYVDVERIRNTSSFLESLTKLQKTATEFETILYLGGTAKFEPEALDNLQWQWVENYESLVKSTRKDWNRLRP